MKRLDSILEFIIGSIKAAAFLAMVVLLIPVALLYKQIRPDQPFAIPCLFHRLLIKLLGIRVRVTGAPSTASPVMFVVNHVSYLDIPVLGSILPASFVAKSEVAGWPLFGFLSKVQNTLFIERRSTRRLRKFLHAGQCVHLPGPG